MARTLVRSLPTCLAVAFLAGTSLAEVEHYWRGAGTGGNTATDPADPTTQWDNPANWSGDGAPSGDNADAVFWCTNAGRIYVDSAARWGRWSVSGISPEAELHVGASADLQVGHLGVGTRGIGHLVQHGGRISAELALGGERGAIGTYTMYDGELIGGRYSDSIGYWGTGRFIQHGGLYTPDELYLSSGDEAEGLYELHGGELRTSCTNVGWIYRGTFIQTGGLHSIGSLPMGSFAGAHGHYELSGGSLEVCNWETVGERGHGELIQTAGTHTIGRSLLIGKGSSSGYSADGSVVLTGGTLDVAEAIYVGNSGTARGALEVGGSARMTTTDLLVSADGAKGTLKITGADARLEVLDTFALGSSAHVSAVDGAAIHLTGGAFENRATDAQAVVGLSRLKMIFGGGGDQAGSFEVASLDRGAGWEGFLRNFALHTLQIGGADAGRVQLTDDVRNHGAAAAGDVLYVRNLIIEPDSTLDLHGLTVYYNTLTNRGSIDPGGGQLIHALLPPEILSLNASTLASRFTPTAGASSLGELTIGGEADLGVELEDRQVTRAACRVELVASLLADASTGGLARGEFGEGQFSIRDDQADLLLSGTIAHLHLEEGLEGSGVLAGSGLLEITGGNLQSDFLADRGEMFQIMFGVTPSGIDGFAEGFTGVSNITLAPVPEPAALAFLALGAVAVIRGRRR